MAEGSEPAFYRRRKKRGDEIGQILLRMGRIEAGALREALRIQAESGGLLGGVLRRMGACEASDIAEALIEQARLARQGKRFLAREARDNPSIAGLALRCRPQAVALLLMAADALAVLISVGLTLLLTAQEGLTLPERFGMFALVPLALAAYSAAGLYAVCAPSPPQEIRSATVATALVYFALWSAAVLTHGGHLALATHLSWLMGLLVTAALVPIARGLTRARFARRPFWGEPVVVFGAGKVGRAVVAALQSRPQLGLRPVAILEDDAAKQGSVRMAWSGDDVDLEPVPSGLSSRPLAARYGPAEQSALEQFSEVDGVPVMGGFELAPMFAQRLGIRSAVIATPLSDAGAVHALIERHAAAYSNVLVVPELYNLAHFGAPTRQLGAILGIEVQRQLLLRWPRLTKRVLDLALTSFGLLMITPLLALIALLIKVDSRGPVFYMQKRLGQDGVRFNAYKFRTMHGDGERRLAEVLARDPALRAEYEQFHKLSNDPRVTRVGRLLRKYSLDELPQLLNVFFGQMSLVGPRPYLEREIAAMTGREVIVLRVKPGITGYWQVTERNATTFEHRVALDVEYVRSWSPWLDLYVIARTIPVVLGGTGS